MAVQFNPSGELNISADASDLTPADLTSVLSKKSVICTAMTRCTNLHLDRAGIASTRRGSSRLSDAAVGTPVYRIVEQGGVRYAFGGTQIYRNGASLGVTGLTSAKWSAIKYNAYNVTTQSIFALNGTDRKRITGSTVAEWGIEPPAIAPTLAGDIAGHAYTQAWELTQGYADTGSYQWRTTSGNYQITYDWEADISANGIDSATSRNMWFFEGTPGYSVSGRVGVVYTYCRKDGATLECESNPSDETYIEAGSGVYATWTASGDSQVTHVRLYRTLVDGTAFYYSHEVAIGTTSDALDVPDASLGSEVEYDHGRPPLGAAVVGPDFNGTCFILKDNLLYFCKPNQPEYWPALYYIEVCPIQEATVGIRLFNGQAYVLTGSEIYLIQGTGYQSFFPLRQSAVTGAVGQDGILAMRGAGVLHVANDGLWAFSGSDDSNVTNANFRPVFQGTTTQGIDGRVLANMENCWLLSHLGKLYFGFPGGAAMYPSEILVLDLGTKRFSHYDYGQVFSAACVDETNGRILAADASGYLWVLEDASVTTDNSAAISWDWQSAEVSDQVRVYMPRSAKYDVEVGGTATAQVILDGSSIQSHTLAGSRITTKRLITGDNGKRLQSRIYGTGAVDIYAVELE